jgi:signal transduction histidine kinase
VGADDVSRLTRRLAEALLLDVEKIAARSVARMQELLPAYARVPREDLLPVTRTNTRHLLEAIRDPEVEPGREDRAYRASGETRARQGITSDEMLNAWRIGLESVREEAHVVCRELGLDTNVLLEFVDATLRWGDLGMRASASAHHEAEIRDLGRLVEEQAALRRVATLVARGVRPADVFGAVCAEVARVIGAEAGVVRFETDGEGLVFVASTLLPVGTRCELDDARAAAAVYRTGRSARTDGLDRPSRTGLVAAMGEREGVLSMVASPIVVEGRLWGAVAVSSSETLPADVEERLEKFTELVGAAIANADAREQIERLAEEQAALRRVATVVAGEPAPHDVFAAVAEEVGRVLRLEATAIWRYDADAHAAVVGSWGETAGGLPAGFRWAAAGGDAIGLVHRTHRPARVDGEETDAGVVEARTRLFVPTAEVACPITVAGRLWGAIGAVASEARAMPPDAEERIARFTELVATAIANFEARAEVAASRARIEAAADEERRRLVRDLHDGAQARLVHTIVTLKLARAGLARFGAEAAALLDEPLVHAQRATDEVRSLARGILPSALARGGLAEAVRERAAAMTIPVDIDVAVDRLPGAVEATAYFIVAEALTNTVKHAGARRALVRARVDRGALQLEVRDDGAGGADPGGAGLVGLGDRLAALGGRMRVDSPTEGGTRLAASIPVEDAPSPRRGAERAAGGGGRR